MTSVNPKKFIFLHIPKTAGTSLRELVTTQYPGPECLYLYYPVPYTPETITTINTALPAAKMLYGHVSFGIHEWLNIDGKYITFLRHPLERVISLYYHHAREEAMPYYSAIQQGMSLLDLLEQEITPETNNHIVRILACNGQEGMLDDDAVYIQAIENIRQHFYYVGLMEKFSTSVTTLAQKLSWQLPETLPYVNVKPSAQTYQIDRRTKAALIKYNRLDLQLYQQATKAFPRIVEKVRPFKRWWWYK